ncbi:MAG: hypothetical protein M3Z04_13565 [Chloroflexota bacterium]|nr:hypothetical protein [Chloroflexota bacterium]
MKRLHWILKAAVLLITLAFVAISVARSRTEATEKWAMALPQVLPPALARFPDIEQVPIYPYATVTSTETKSLWSNDITYYAIELPDRVAAYYDVMLHKKGWLLRKGGNNRNFYSWTDPTGKMLWQMQLEVVVELYPGGTAVQLGYGRYPNPAAGLPVYPNAQQVAVTHSTLAKQGTSTTNTPVQVTEMTYLSSASPQEIATFYANAMPEAGLHQQEPGWSIPLNGSKLYPFVNPGSWAGDSRSEGLYFLAGRPTGGANAALASYDLLVTATLQKDGQVRITLHLVESESSLGNF